MGLEASSPVPPSSQDGIKVNGSLTQTVGLPDAPQPAPRRLSSTTSDSKMTNGGSGSATTTSPASSRKADEEPQVTAT